MHPDDHAAMARTMTPGAPPPDWSVWLGSRAGAADYLTTRGLEVFDIIHQRIPELFGDEWLARALDPQHRMPEARILSPLMALSDPVEQFVTLLRIWTVIELGDAGVLAGTEQIPVHLRNDVTASRLWHSLGQFELAGAGWHIGAAAELEPAKPDGGGPCDLALRTTDTEVYLELTTLATGEGFTVAERAFDRQTDFLRTMDVRYGVEFDGDVPGLLPEADELVWCEEVEAAAARCAEAAHAVDVERLDTGRHLIVRPRGAGGPARLEGPLVELDSGRRLLSKIERKARRQITAGLGWIVVDDHTETLPLTEFGKAILEEKIFQLHGLLGSLFDRHLRLAGIVWMRTGRVVSPPAAHQVQTAHGLGFLRALPGLRLRESVILPRPIMATHQTALLGRLFAREPEWLDAALGALGYSAGLAELVRRPLTPPAARSELWIPGHAG